MFLHLSYTTILDSGGKPVKAYGTSQDKTREKAVKQQYEYELRFINSDTQKRFIAKGHHDLTANRIISYYRSEFAALDVTGMTYDDAYRSLPAMIADEDDCNKYLELFNREHVIARFRSGESHFSMEYRRRGGINPAMWVRIEGRTYQNPSTGNIEGFLYNYDITGQKFSSSFPIICTALATRALDLSVCRRQKSDTTSWRKMVETGLNALQCWIIRKTQIRSSCVTYHKRSRHWCWRCAV